MVGLRTPSSSLQHSHDTRHVEISCAGFFATRFLNTIFQLQKFVSKTYKAKLSTADALYVVDGKITLVAVVQKRCNDFEQNWEHLKELKLKK